MSKQTFQIPEGCKAVTVEQVGNQIITTFEPVFKRGDVLINEDWAICILDKINGNYIYEIVGLFEIGMLTYRSDEAFDLVFGFRHATLEEAQRLWDALAKNGKRWNPETMEVEEIKKEIPRAKVGGAYWYFNGWLDVIHSIEYGYDMDDSRHCLGNYFLSYDQAQRAADKLKQALAEFWKEELK